MTVDEQGAACIVAVTGKVNLADELGGYVEQPARGIETDIVRADCDVVHVDEQFAAAAAGELAEEAGLAPAMLVERQIVCRILDQDFATERVLHLADVGAEAGKHLVRPRQWQEIGEAPAIETRPGEMFRNQRRFEPID